MMSRWLLAIALLVPMVGCTDLCVDPPEGSTVTVARVDEEARTLPLMRSGETGVVQFWPGYNLVNVPDAHGYLDMTVNMTGFPNVQVRDLELSIAVAGKPVAVKLLRVYGGASTFLQEPEGNRWSDEVRRNTTLRLYWAVEPATDFARLVLAEGAPYAATVSFDWSYRGCSSTFNGRVDQTFDDFVQASANARTFEPAGPAQVERAPTGVGFLAPFRIRSGLDVDVDRVEVVGFYLGGGATARGNADLPTPGVTGVASAGGGIVAFPSVAWEVDGANVSLVTPSNELAVFSSGLDGAYAPTGAPAAVAGDALFVLLVGIHYTPTDPTLGATRDDFALPVVLVSSGQNT